MRVYRSLSLPIIINRFFLSSATQPPKPKVLRTQFPKPLP